ncbi:acetoacetate decarboxylase [compost metagenome]
MAASEPEFSPSPAFPPAPWHLQGEFFAVGGLMPIARAKAFVPTDLEIVSVLPGMTLGAIAAARYTEGSILTYSELLVVPALVRSGGKTGGWISHIYVDDETSLQGGRSIWGLPKELATFEWESLAERGSNSTLLRVSQHGKLILDFWAAPRWVAAPTAFDLPIISLVEGRPSPWHARISSRTRMTSTHLEIPPDAPFAGLRPQSLLGIHGENLDMDVARP